VVAATWAGACVGPHPVSAAHMHIVAIMENIRFIQTVPIRNYYI